MDDRRTRWVQVFARLKPGYTVESAQAPLQGLFTQIRAYEMTLPAAKDWSKYSREQFMKGQLLVESAAMGFSRLRNDFSTRAGRADVHGRPGAADRLRQRRQPADRARPSCARRRSRCGCRSARRADGWSGSCSSRAWCCRSPAASSASVSPFVLTRGLLALDPVARAAAADHAPARICRILAFTLVLTFVDRHRLRPAAGAAREPSGSRGPR